MAKRQRNQLVTVAFNYLVKSFPDPNDPENRIEEGFSEREFQRVVDRLSDTRQLDDRDDRVVRRIKVGEDLPYTHYEQPEEGLHFGGFEGAYYGQQYRNNRLGIIDADSLNLRGFHYIMTKLRDGKILVGVTYHGHFGDYDGLRSCLTHLLHGDYRVASKTLRSVSGEIGGGQAISLKLTYRKAPDRAERKPLFGSSGVIAVKNTDFGNEFQERVIEAAGRIRGTDAQRKQALAQLVNQGDMLELDADDIIGCSAVIREDGRQRTVYFLGDNNFATKFPLAVGVDQNGVVNREQVKAEMTRVMREHILPLMG
jgi:hypothetical protein